MLNRKTAPAFHTIESIEVLQATKNTLSNGLPVYTLSAGSQEICRLEFVFRAGMYHQPATLIASATNNLLETGSRQFTADQISDGVDFYGSFLEVQVEQDFASITLYCLNKYLAQSLVFVEDLLKHPTFPESEFRIYINNKKQKHAINSQKVSVLARRKFTELLFGAAHPYGRDVQEADYERVNLSEIREFFGSHYGYQNCSVFAAGKLPEDLIGQLDKSFGQSDWPAGAKAAGNEAVVQTSAQKRTLIERDDALQSALRVGRILFNKRHADYFNFQVLNTVLGGYFGSRLMANIREDKGYTYGIGSGITNLVHGGYFFISTEVGAEVTLATLDEIYREFKILREKLIPASELDTVRNYMLGNFLRSVDGPFALCDKFKSIWEYGLDYSYFDRYFDAVKSVTPAQLRDLANRYLQDDHMLECIAGKV